MAQHVRQHLSVDLALQPEPPSDRPDPLPRRLLRAGVVLLRSAGERVDLVLLLTPRQLPQPQTASPPPVDPLGGSSGPARPGTALTRSRSGPSRRQREQGGRFE